MKEKVNRLLNYLSGIKSEEQYVCPHCGRLGHPVMIGNVISKAKRNESDDPFEYSKRDNHERILLLWRECGCAKSLNEIIEKSGWDKADFEKIVNGEVVDKWKEQLKDPNARSLVEFLLDIFKDELK